jgi:hypothetical protein
MTKLERAKELEKEMDGLRKGFEIIRELILEKNQEQEELVLDLEQISEIKALGDYSIVVYTHLEELSFAVVQLNFEEESDEIDEKGIKNTNGKIEKVGDISDEEFEALLKIINKGKNNEKS